MSKNEGSLDRLQARLNLQDGSHARGQEIGMSVYSLWESRFKKRTRRLAI